MQLFGREIECLVVKRIRFLFNTEKGGYATITKGNKEVRCIAGSWGTSYSARFDSSSAIPAETICKRNQRSFVAVRIRRLLERDKRN